MERKLQIFISSTYQDLIEERERAIKVILKYGHIPAGMELFQPGNEPSKEVIRKWIDESDAYILILGYRYGSIEKESGLSFTHWEYSYAVETGKELFCVLLNDNDETRKMRLEKDDYSKIMETKSQKEYSDFRNEIREKHQTELFSNLSELENALAVGIHSLNNRITSGGWYRFKNNTSNIHVKNEGVKSNDFREMIQKRRLTPKELLFLLYAKEQEVYDFEYGISTKSRLRSISNWESKNMLKTDLSDNYFSLIELLSDRNILEPRDLTIDELPRSYRFNINIYTDLINSEDYSNELDLAKTKFKIVLPLEIDPNELPF